MNLLLRDEEPVRIERKTWTEEDDARIRELRSSGCTWPIINAIFGRDARKRYDRIKLTPEERAARRTRASDINTTWTVEQVETLKRCYFEGLSYALMAPQVGLSKNACIGKARRLGLPPRVVTKTLPCASRMKGSTRKNYARLRIVRANTNSDQLRLFESIQSDLGQLRCVEVPSLDLTIDQLTETSCRFIAGDTPLYCGNTIYKRSYCADHFALCYTVPLPPKVYAMRSVA